MSPFNLFQISQTCYKCIVGVNNTGSALILNQYIQIKEILFTRNKTFESIIESLSVDKKGGKKEKRIKCDQWEAHHILYTHLLQLECRREVDGICSVQHFLWSEVSNEPQCFQNFFFHKFLFFCIRLCSGVVKVTAVIWSSPSSPTERLCQLLSSWQ